MGKTANRKSHSKIHDNSKTFVKNRAKFHPATAEELAEIKGSNRGPEQKDEEKPDPTQMENDEFSGSRALPTEPLGSQPSSPESSQGSRDGHGILTMPLRVLRGFFRPK